jgi:hypothetical protein
VCERFGIGVNTPGSTTLLLPVQNTLTISHGLPAAIEVNRRPLLPCLLSVACDPTGTAGPACGPALRLWGAAGRDRWTQRANA